MVRIDPWNPHQPQVAYPPVAYVPQAPAGYPQVPAYQPAAYGYTAPQGGLFPRNDEQFSQLLDFQREQFQAAREERERANRGPSLLEQLLPALISAAGPLLTRLLGGNQAQASPRQTAASAPADPALVQQRRDLEEQLQQRQAALEQNIAEREAASSPRSSADTDEQEAPAT